MFFRRHTPCVGPRTEDHLYLETEIWWPEASTSTTLFESTGIKTVSAGRPLLAQHIPAWSSPQHHLKKVDPTVETEPWLLFWVKRVTWTTLHTILSLSTVPRRLISRTEFRFPRPTLTESLQNVCFVPCQQAIVHVCVPVGHHGTGFLLACVFPRMQDAKTFRLFGWYRSAFDSVQGIFLDLLSSAVAKKATACASRGLDISFFSAHMKRSSLDAFIRSCPAGQMHLLFWTRNSHNATLRLDSHRESAGAVLFCLFYLLTRGGPPCRKHGHFRNPTVEAGFATVEERSIEEGIARYTSKVHLLNDYLGETVLACGLHRKKRCKMSGTGRLLQCPTRMSHTMTDSGGSFSCVDIYPPESLDHHSAATYGHDVFKTVTFDRYLWFLLYCK